MIWTKYRLSSWTTRPLSTLIPRSRSVRSLDRKRPRQSPTNLARDLPPLQQPAALPSRTAAPPPAACLQQEDPSVDKNPHEAVQGASNVNASNRPVEKPSYISPPQFLLPETPPTLPLWAPLLRLITGSRPRTNKVTSLPTVTTVGATSRLKIAVTHPRTRKGPHTLRSRTPTSTISSITREHQTPTREICPLLLPLQELSLRLPFLLVSQN